LGTWDGNPFFFFWPWLVPWKDCKNLANDSQLASLHSIIKNKIIFRRKSEPSNVCFYWLTQPVSCPFDCENMYDISLWSWFIFTKCLTDKTGYQFGHLVGESCLNFLLDIMDENEMEWSLTSERNDSLLAPHIWKRNTYDMYLLWFMLLDSVLLYTFL
jgi:hypothetical protein